MIETHPFGDFVPINSRYLLIGSFTTIPFEGYDWFYSNKVNQFWPILEKVYECRLATKTQKQKLFKDLKMALTDIILSCRRTKGSHMDNNLTDIILNTKGINNIVDENDIEKVYFTSRFVETLFKKNFKNILSDYSDIEFVYLPSPSPRYAKMTKEEKIKVYKNLLPKLKK